MPERIGAYRLESPLGRGGMGEVFLAWDERLERAVAIKRIRQDVFLQDHQRERFRREARMAARLSHASIVQIHDLVSEESGDAIVMEYVEGLTLSERLARGPLATDEAIRLAREIAEGLAAAHEAGLIHRDLKAENVVVTPSGHSKILDFGLARPVSWDGEMLTLHGALIGTCYAMSPEQARGEELDERSDLFSFGALLYEMLTGCSPFRGKDPLATLQRVLHEQPPLLSEVRPDLPLRLSSLVERLLAKDRAVRPRDALQVVDKLALIERELPVAERPEQSDDSVSDMPTYAFPVLPGTRSGGMPASQPARVAKPSPLHRSRSWILFLAGALVALMIAVTISNLRARRPLRVLVMWPSLSEKTDERLAQISTGVLDSSLNSLANLKGISVIDPTTVPDSTLVRDAAHNATADEVLVSDIKKDGRMAVVYLRRVDAKGRFGGWSNKFRVPTDSTGLRLLNEWIDKSLRHAFKDFPPRTNRIRLAATDLDYSEYLEVRRHLDAGMRDLKPDLEQLERIIERTPDFLEARVLAAELAHSLYQSTRKRSDLERARFHIRQAQQLAPDDPRALRVEFQVALTDQRLDDASTILTRLEDSQPWDPEVQIMRFSLEESQGRLEEAEEALRQAVEMTPSWRNISWLASFELEHGKISESRSHLEELLSRMPENIWVREQLAYLELIYGDLERAEKIYGELARSQPQQSAYFVSLGQARSLRGLHKEAAQAYRHALEIDPGHVIAMLNLADTELDLGNKLAADGSYRAVLQHLEDNRIGPSLPPQEEMMKAQCLARTGRAAEAREAVRNALNQAHQDPQRFFEAALVHSVIGDQPKALDYMAAALDHGMPPLWFKASAFDSLRSEPRFKEALLKSERPEQGR